MKLYAHQQSILDKNPSKTLLAWGTGTGKSLAGIELLKKNGAKEAMIICPKSIKSKWIADTPGGYMVLTKEEFKKQAPLLKRYNHILVDEAHYFSGNTSAMSKFLIKYIEWHKVEYVYLLTATPYLSSIWGIYTLARILGYNPSYQSFKKKYFDMIPMGRRRIPVQKKKVVNDNGVIIPMEDEVARLVNKIGDTVKIEDCIDVPRQTFLVEEFELTSEQKTAIKNLDDIVPISRWTKFHQICGGSLKGDGYSPNQMFKSEKLARILDLAKEHKKLVIVARYNHERDIIINALKKYNIYHISANEKDVAGLAQEADKQEKAIVVVSGGISEGYELPSFPIMVFYSYDFSLKNYIQMLGRILRINKLKKNVYISLIVKDSVDEDVYSCIMNKRNFDIAIYDKDKAILKAIDIINKS